jgi:hypothetical protein
MATTVAGLLVGLLVGVGLGAAFGFAFGYEWAVDGWGRVTEPAENNDERN